MEDQELFELVCGNLLGKTPSSLSSQTVGIVITRLGFYVRQTNAGSVHLKLSFQCFPNDPDLVRRPDIAFILTDRLSQVVEVGHVRVAPDLAIKVISPKDRIYDPDGKLDDYWSAGVKLEWTVNPKFRWIRIHRPDRTMTELHESDTLTGDSILPQFSIVVQGLLP